MMITTIKIKVVIMMITIVIIIMMMMIREIRFRGNIRDFKEFYSTLRFFKGKKLQKKS